MFGFEEDLDVGAFVNDIGDRAAVAICNLAVCWPLLGKLDVFEICAVDSIVANISHIQH